MDIVTAAGLTKYYDGLKAVDGVDFEIREGDCFALLAMTAKNTPYGL